MNKLIDANYLYDAGTLAIKSSNFKYATHMYEMNHLIETAELQRDLKSGEYVPLPGSKFPIQERGKLRYITSNVMRDKTVNHVMCDEIVMPAITPHLIHDNGASQKGKGTSFTRRRFEEHLHSYYMEHKSNEGYVLLLDFSGYYANILHSNCKAVLHKMILPTLQTEEERELVTGIIDNIFRSYETDVSYLTDEQIEQLYVNKVDPLMNMNVLGKLLTGEKMLKKGVDIGNQLSQSIGIVYPYRIDNYVKIVKGCKRYGRYTDDSYVIHHDEEFLKEVLAGIQSIAQELGLIINMKKTRIVKLSSFFRFLQVGYSLTDTGRVIKKINPKNVTRERRKLKAYKRLLDAGKIEYSDIENSFKSWLGTHWKLMSRIQIRNLKNLYYELFGKVITWNKKKNSRLSWLMEHA